MTFDQHHGAGWMDADPYPLKRLWLAVQYCSFKLLHLQTLPLVKVKRVCACLGMVLMSRCATSPTSKRKEEEESDIFATIHRMQPL